MPTLLISYATLEFVGYTPAEATSLWALWRSWYPDDVPRDKKNFETLSQAFRQLLELRLHETGTGMPDCYCEDEGAWTVCMDTYGIKKELQREILSPSSQELRLRHSWNYSCMSWVKSELRSRFWCLKAVRD